MMEKHTTSTSRIIICLVTILLLRAPTAHGDRLKAKIEFEPKTVVPIVTPRLSLKCTLVPADPKDEDGVVDVKAVLGVTIKQKNATGEFETVASVSDPDDPKLYGHWDDKDTAADAHLNDHSRLLEVNVTDPTVEHTGDMLCEIVVNDGEAVETLSNQDTIGYQEPDMKILLSELRRLKLENEDQQQEISTQQQNISAQQQEMVSQIEKLQDAQDDITNLTSRLATAESYISTKVSFSAVMENGKSTEYVSYGTVLAFNEAPVNIGGGYDTSTGVFTCPVAGTYYIRYDLGVVPANPERKTNSAVNLELNGAPVTFSHMSDADRDSFAQGVIGNGLVLQLKKGDELKLRT